MAKRSYGAGLGSAVVFCLASCSPRDVQAFVVPSLDVSSRGRSLRSAWSRGGGGAVVGTRGVRARTVTGLEVASGGSAVGSASALSTDDDEDGMRVDQIQAFTGKVRDDHRKQ